MWNDIRWWFEGKYLAVRLTFNQMVNVYFKNRTINENGLQFYDYCAKVAFENYHPQTYKETMFEDDIKDEMIKQNCERKIAASFCGGRLAQYMKPSTFWSSERPGKFICA